MFIDNIQQLMKSMEHIIKFNNWEMEQVIQYDIWVSLNGTGTVVIFFTSHSMCVIVANKFKRKIMRQEELNENLETQFGTFIFAAENLETFTYLWSSCHTIRATDHYGMWFPKWHH